MRSFDLGRTFDAVTCLFSAIGYMASTEELDQAIGAMARHLSPGGVLIVDGWVRPQAWRDPGTTQALAAGRDGRAAARVVRSRREGSRCVLELHHLLGADTGVEYSVETHVLSLFSDDDYRQAFDRAGLASETLPSPHPDRDRYIGVASAVRGSTPWRERSAGDVLNAMVAMFASGDPSRAAEVVAADYIDHQGLGAGPVEGVEGFAQIVRTNSASYTHQEISIEDLFGVEDRAVARIRWRGERRDGESVDKTTIDVIRVAEGRAVEHWGASA